MLFPKDYAPTVGEAKSMTMSSEKCIVTSTGRCQQQRS